MKLRHPVLRGHPMHAMLSDLPIALIPTALLAAVAARSGKRRAVFASDASTVLALATGTAAALVGWWDWTTIPEGHRARRPATIHGTINSVLLGVVAAALIRPSSRMGWLALANGGLLVAAWIGGDLVYALGWRVRPAEELELMEEDLRARGLLALHDRAREEVDRHERTETFLPRSPSAS